MKDRGARYLIVNGDDFGISAGVSRGIVEAHRQGILTSTSLMVERPAAPDAARLARQLPALSVGLHLELDGRRDADPRAVAARQLERFEELMGCAPTHLDSHHDVHQDPRVLSALRELTQPLGIPLRGHSAARPFSRFYGSWAGETHLEQVSVDSLIGMLESFVEGGVTELMCHPGYADAELRSSYAEARETELRTLCDPRVREAVDRAGIRLLGFRELPALLAER